MTATLKVSSDGFLWQKGFRKATVKWADIKEIVGVHLPKATYDENFLIIKTNRAIVEAGELDRQFRDFERMLLERFPDFPRDWRIRVEAAGADERTTLWLGHR
jgi:hypothetical protein